MPFYEYQCKKCGHRFDRIGKHNDPDPPCPALAPPTDENESDEADVAVCGEDTERLISTSSFILKGGGWANTGYS